MEWQVQTRSVPIFIFYKRTEISKSVTVFLGVYGEFIVEIPFFLVLNYLPFLVIKGNGKPDTKYLNTLPTTDYSILPLDSFPVERHKISGYELKVT